MFLIVFFLSGAVCNPPGLNITAPKKMEALSGSCLQIPCTFIPNDHVNDKFSSTRPVVGVWMKSDHRFDTFKDNVIFNSSMTDNMYPMKISGNLSQRNCDTIFSSLITNYSDTYFFRIVNWPFRATAVNDPLRITVKDSPPVPRIDLSGELMEDKHVSLTCSALTPCPNSPPVLTWTLPLDAVNKTEENQDRTITTKSQVTFILSDQHDGLNITCSASYAVNQQRDKTAQETVMLNVSYSPKNTSAHLSPAAGPLSLGVWVNLTCSSRAKPPVSRFTWFKSTKDGSFNVSEGGFYSFNVTGIDDGGVYYCVATNALGSQTSPGILLTVEGSEPPGNFAAILGGIAGIILLICVVVFVWWLKASHKTLQTQNQIGEEPAAQAEEEEEIHYGAIDFSKLKPRASSNAAQVNGEQQDTEYAEVKVTNTPTQTNNAPEDIYAQVKKH